MKIQFLILAAAAVLGTAGYFFWPQLEQYFYAPHSSEVHVHADFAVYVYDKKLTLTDNKYQSSAESLKHKHVHLHDGDDTVVHRHAEGITFAEFLESIGFALTNDCFTKDTGEVLCTDDNNVLTLYVNRKPVADALSYIPQEEDQILLYYGARDNAQLEEYLDSITEDSCIFSGTCPERGLPPLESCGITCET